MWDQEWVKWFALLRLLMTTSATAAAGGAATAVKTAASRAKLRRNLGRSRCVQPDADFEVNH